MQCETHVARERDGQALLNCIVDVDTSTVPPAEQFDLYRSWNSDLGDVTLLREKFRAFNAHQKVWRIGTLALLSLDYPGTGYHRRWSSKKNPVFDHWILSVPRIAGSRAVKAHSGNLRWHCLAAPYEAESKDDGALALIVPRDFAFTQPSELFVRPEMAGLIVDYIELLHRSLPHRTERDAEHTANATTTLLAACITCRHNQLIEAEGPINAVIMARAKKLIAAQLADRNLSPDTICRDLSVSRSRLYRIFEATGGIANYIRRQRLLRTKDLISDKTNRRSISSIAEEWGFMDPSTYSRTFRREFGVTPKEARHAGWLRLDHPFLPSATGGNEPSLHTIMAQTAAAYGFADGPL
jgi:AraC-like DNA-binding protein